MLITITEASKIAGYKSRSSFREMFRKRFGYDHPSVQKVGGFYVIEKSFVESLEKNEGQGRNKKNRLQRR